MLVDVIKFLKIKHLNIVVILFKAFIVNFNFINDLVLYSYINEYILCNKILYRFCYTFNTSSIKTVFFF